MSVFAEKSERFIKTAVLPYWSSEIDIEVSSCLPWGLDYKPISGGTFFNSEMRRAASDCMKHGSELLFIASHVTGCVGMAVSDCFYKGVMPGIFSPGFIMLLGYSDQMELLVADSIIKNKSEVLAGISFCSLWRGGVLVGSLKVIAVTSYMPFFDPSEFLNKFFNVISSSEKNENLSAVPYYAEKFGHMRFTAPYYTDDPTSLTISRLLIDMELDASRQVVGPSPQVDFPAAQIIALPFANIN